MRDRNTMIVLCPLFLSRRLLFYSVDTPPVTSASRRPQATKDQGQRTKDHVVARPVQAADLPGADPAGVPPGRRQQRPRPVAGGPATLAGRVGRGAGRFGAVGGPLV